MRCEPHNSSWSKTRTRSSVTRCKAASFVRKASQPAVIAVATCKASGVRRLYRARKSAALIAEVYVDWKRPKVGSVEQQVAVLVMKNSISPAEGMNENLG